MDRVARFRTADGRLPLDRVYRGYVTVYPSAQGRAGAFRLYATPATEARIWKRDAVYDAERLRAELWSA